MALLNSNNGSINLIFKAFRVIYGSTKLIERRAFIAS